MMNVFRNLKKQFSFAKLGILLIDIVCVFIAYYTAYYFRFGGEIPENYRDFLFDSLPMVLLVKVYFIYDFKLYKSAWKYTSIYEVIALFKATIIGNMGVVLVIWLAGLVDKLPRLVIAADWCFSFIILGGVRILPRLLSEGLSEPFWKYFYYFIKYHKLKIPERRVETKKILIYGAGDVGQMIVRDIRLNKDINYTPVGFIDDNPSKKNKIIHGVEIIGGRDFLQKAVDDRNVDEIIISISTAHGKAMREIIELCDRTGKVIKIVPSILEIVDGKINISSIRNIKLEDLLGREQVNLDVESISEYIENESVLVTGAGGSIGSELCRQIMKFNPSRLILFGRGENSIFSIHTELKTKYPDKRIVQVIGDVINKKKVERVFQVHKPDIVFHAGADKHVPLMEMNPDEAVLNNIIGTQNVIGASDQFNVGSLICVSTDKAVNPTSIMGTCKRVTEKLIQGRNRGTTKVMGVRFGNVLGSRGSVIPLFEQQIKNGGPVTVTHKDMTRFLMTIPEAAQLVIQAGAIGDNSELFVLDMGEPVSIDQMARTMIKLAGYKPEEEIDIVYTGIRLGEKLYEELARPSENQNRTRCQKIFRIIDRNENDNMTKLDEDIKELKRSAIEMDYDRIYEKLSEMIPEYGDNRKRYWHFKG